MWHGEECGSRTQQLLLKTIAGIEPHSFRSKAIWCTILAIHLSILYHIHTQNDFLMTHHSTAAMAAVPPHLNWCIPHACFATALPPSGLTREGKPGERDETYGMHLTIVYLVHCCTTKVILPIRYHDLFRIYLVGHLSLSRISVGFFLLAGAFFYKNLFFNKSKTQQSALSAYLNYCCCYYY